MITFSDSQQKMVNELEAVNCAHWIDNHNGTISCSYCSTWFYKDDRYSYMNYCSYCGKKMEDKQAKEVNTIEIPKNATNGDMIKAMFPDSEIKEIRGTFKGDLLGYRTWLGGCSRDFLLDWWNEPFKRGKEE